MALVDLPNITDSDLNSDKAKTQIKNYLYSLTEQLRYLLNNLDTDNFTTEVSEQINASSKLGERVDNTKSELGQAIANATKALTQEMGGYVIKRKGELLIMDTEHTETATKVWRFNLNGIGYSSQGIDGPYRLAATMDGTIIADFITAGTLTSIVLESDNYIAGVQGTRMNLNDGSIDARNFKIDAYGNVTFKGQILGGTFTTTGNRTTGESDTTTIEDGHINSTYIILGDITDPFHSTVLDYSQLYTNVITTDTIRGKVNDTLNIPGIINTDSVVCDALTIIGKTLITSANIAQQNVNYAATAGSAGSSSSCSTGYLSLSSGTLQAPAGSLWIGQNTVKANTIEQTSSKRFKKCIKKYKGNALELICNTPVKTYRYKKETKENKLHLGMIVEESPQEVINEEGLGLDIGAVAALAWKGIQEQQKEIMELKKEIKALKEKLNA